MKVTQYTYALLVVFSLVFVGEAEAKQHGSKQARSRVLKEMNNKGSSKLEKSK